MKTALFAAALAGATVIAFAQTPAPDTLDLSSLDKLAAKAKESTHVSLDREKLKAMMSMAPNADKDQGIREASKALEKVNAIEVRNFEFENTGAYSMSDLDPVLAQLKSNGWSKMVDVQEKAEHVGVYVRTGAKKGFVVVSAEPKEVTVVNIDGSLENLADLRFIPQVTSAIQFHGPAPDGAPAH